MGAMYRRLWWIVVRVLSEIHLLFRVSAAKESVLVQSSVEDTLELNVFSQDPLLADGSKMAGFAAYLRVPSDPGEFVGSIV